MLDCGLGTGALSLALHRITPLPLQLHGVDVSPKMVATAQQRLAQVGASLQGKTHDIAALPYADHSFDLVMSAHTLEHLPNARVALNEMMRVLKPGGVLLLVTTRRGLFGSLLDARWGLNCLQPHRLHTWLTESGFTDITWPRLGGPPWCRWMSYGCLARKCSPL